MISAGTTRSCSRHFWRSAIWPRHAPGARQLGQWREAFLAYFTTRGANNGGTEAVNFLIELHRRVARGFRNLQNYTLGMLLIAGGLNL
ncbi:hypothetical protein N865_01140 [Intrasporangium oryzae NRRL B-24470]|uniref:Transposase IS204/IS1001/IS1096/IS1165 DDE domain-containing protein n=1 Tax=Intrasporangium oryzae NRRL B-24470 TaxID=1386089 RepID=W9G6W3_9MICO|nr:hypothetical protein N865_01140 [Intrasporangium oryzae NRRL B-24470]